MGVGEARESAVWAGGKAGCSNKTQFQRSPRRPLGFPMGMCAPAAVPPSASQPAKQSASTARHQHRSYSTV